MARYFTESEPITYGDVRDLLHEHTTEVEQALGRAYGIEDRLEAHHSDIADLKDTVEGCDRSVDALYEVIESLKEQIAELQEQLTERVA